MTQPDRLAELKEVAALFISAAETAAAALTESLRILGDALAPPPDNPTDSEENEK